MYSYTILSGCRVNLHNCGRESCIFTRFFRVPCKNTRLLLQHKHSHDFPHHALGPFLNYVDCPCIFIANVIIKAQTVPITYIMSVGIPAFFFFLRRLYCLTYCYIQLWLGSRMYARRETDILLPLHGLHQQSCQPIRPGYLVPVGIYARWTRHIGCFLSCATDPFHFPRSCFV